MSEIILKIPKRNRRVDLIQSEKMLKDIIVARHNNIKKQFALEELAALLAEEQKKRKEQEQIELDALENLLEYGEDFVEENFTVKEELNIDDAKLLTQQDIAAESKATVVDFNDNLFAEELKNEPEIDIGLPGNRIPLSDKPVYTEIYSISDEKKPTSLIHNKDRNMIDANLVEKYIQNAYDSGYEDCREVANLNALRKIDVANENVRRIDKFMSDLRKHYGSEMVRFNEKLIDLACTIAEVVIEQEVTKNSSLFINQIKKCLDELNEEIVFRITIHPDDKMILEEAKSQLLKNEKSFADTVIATDDSIIRGSCIFSTSAGNIDATISSQINKLREELITIDNENKSANISEENNDIPKAKAHSEAYLKQIEKKKVVNDEKIVNKNDTVEEKLEETESTVDKNNKLNENNELIDENSDLEANERKIDNKNLE